VLDEWAHDHEGYIHQGRGSKSGGCARVNQRKSAVARPWGRKFLGFSFTNEEQPRRELTPKAILRFKERIRALSGRTRGGQHRTNGRRLAVYLRGWLGYFGKCQTPGMLQRLERRVRHRLRSMIWKQLKRGSVRFAALCKRGVSTDLAAKTSGSCHGPWRLANSRALSLALPSAHFDSLGIPRSTGGR